MQVGMAAIFQNTGKHTTDHEVYRNDTRLACMAEDLGFGSVWTVEHHFTDYTMCPDPLQFLTYMAGRTRTAKLGSMVVVLPWHDPLRVSEQISMLDNLSEGRLVLGLGRGAGRVEFDGFRQDMGDSRPRFVESAQCVLQGLERGYCEYQGQFVQQPRVDIRPAPLRTFKGRTYAAAVSPESLPIMAELGVGILIVPQKPWDAVEAEIADYNALYRKIHGEAPPAPIIAGWTFCDADEARAYEMAKRYIGGYWQTVLDHYEFHTGHLAGQKGYEHYGQFGDGIAKRGIDAAVEFFLGLQVWGTPERCRETILRNAQRVGAETFVGVFSYAGMPWHDAEASMRLFAKDVLPTLRDQPQLGRVDWAA